MHSGKDDKLETIQNGSLECEDTDIANKTSEDDNWEEFSEESLSEIEFIQAVSIRMAGTDEHPPLFPDRENTMEQPPPSSESQASWKKVGLVAFLMGLWYILSSSIILVSKSQLSGEGGFNYPLLMTVNSNVVSFWWAAAFTLAQKLVGDFMKKKNQERSASEYQPLDISRADARQDEHHHRKRQADESHSILTRTIDDREAEDGYSSPPLQESVWVTFARMFPISASIAFEIGMSNIALQKLSVTFGTILKGSAPISVMVFGMIFGVEQFSCRVLMSILAICSGLGIATIGQGSFDLLGMILQLLSTALGGIRWALTQRVMQKRYFHDLEEQGVVVDGEQQPNLPTEPNKSISSKPSHAAMTPMTIILYTAPWTAILVLPVAFFLEVPSASDRTWTVFHFLVLFSIGSMVFLLLWTEYELVRHTSSLAVSVGAVFKELSTILGGVVFFGEPMTSLNWIGFVVCQAGIMYFMFLRHFGHS